MATAVDTTSRRSSMTLNWVAFGLVVVGGVNWGLVGLFNFDLIGAIFGDMSSVTRIIYVIVVISALYSAFAIPTLRRRTDVSA